MATDATGTPTSPDSIPKYNTSVDAPSGLGFNAAMDQIQVALSARAKSPAGIVSGEAMIWNGSAFVRSSVTGLTPSGIAGYPADATKALLGDGTWGTPATPTVTYSPAWTSSGTAPSLGNGTLTGRYQQIGKWVRFSISLTMGSTSTSGTGNWSLSLPVTALAAIGYVGHAEYVDASPVNVYPALVRMFTTTTLVFDVTAQPVTVVWGATVPVTIANADTLTVIGQYEAA